MRTVFILLTKHNDLLAKGFNFLTFTKYSHVSIAIEDESNHFFSFVTRGGFYLERPFMSKKAHKKARECALYKLNVSEEIYQMIKTNIQAFQSNAHRYRYSFLGLVLCLLNISYRRKYFYFCSQFVSELLKKSGAIQVEKQTTLFLPDDFRYEKNLELCFKGTIGELTEMFPKFVNSFCSI